MRRAGVAAAVAVLVLGACSPQPAPTPTPTPSVQTYTCIDDGLRKSGECSKSDYDKQQAEQATFTEAQKVYKAFTAERSRVTSAGGAEEPTAEMMKYAEGVYLDEISRFEREQHAAGRRVKGQISVSDLRIDRSRTISGADFALHVCEDGRHMEVTNADGSAYGKGKLVRGTVFLKNSPQGLRLFDADLQEATACVD